MSKLQIWHFVAITCGLIAGHGFIAFAVLNPSWVNMVFILVDLPLIAWGYHSFRVEIRYLREQAIRRKYLATAGQFEDIRRRYMEDLLR